MTRDQISMIEERLRVKLPPAYKKVLMAFPWPEFSGGSELSLFDDAALN